MINPTVLERERVREMLNGEVRWSKLIRTWDINRWIEEESSFLIANWKLILLRFPNLEHLMNVWWTFDGRLMSVWSYTVEADKFRSSSDLHTHTKMMLFREREMLTQRRWCWWLDWGSWLSEVDLISRRTSFVRELVDRTGAQWWTFVETVWTIRLQHNLISLYKLFFLI